MFLTQTFVTPSKKQRIIVAKTILSKHDQNDTLKSSRFVQKNILQTLHPPVDDSRFCYTIYMPIRLDLTTGA